MPQTLHLETVKPLYGQSRPPVWFSSRVDEGLTQEFGLTPAEMALLYGIGDGLAPSEFAAKQGKSLNTVRSQIGALYEKLFLDDLNLLHLFAIGIRRLAAFRPFSRVDDPLTIANETARVLQCALDREMDHGSPLSDTEKQILGAALRGEKASAIATKRHRSVHTIRTQIQKALNKYEVAGVFCLRHKLGQGLTYETQTSLAA